MSDDLQKLIKEAAALRRLADQFSGRAAELEQRLIRFARHEGVPTKHITKELPHEYPQDVDAKVKHAMKVTVQRYAHKGITRDHLIGRCRTVWVARIRHLAMYVARITTDASFPHIGHVFERDHVTVRHAVQKIEHECEMNRSTLAEVEALALEITG